MGIYATCTQILSLTFLVHTEAILSGGNEGSLSSESDDESGDEPEMSQGTVETVFMACMAVACCTSGSMHM